MPSPTTSSALSWPAEAVAEPILRNWIGVASNENGTQVSHNQNLIRMIIKFFAKKEESP